jgi:hypothetical protein
MFIFFIIGLFAPLINDFFSNVFKLNPLKLLAYFAYAYILYPSMIVVSFTTFIQCIFGKKPKFLVTPTDNHKFTL